MNKILEGKIAKFYEEVCLLKQEYIKDDKKNKKEGKNTDYLEKYLGLLLKEMENRNENY